MRSSSLLLSLPLLLVVSGCFDSTGGGPDDPPGRGDGGVRDGGGADGGEADAGPPVLTRCEDALSLGVDGLDCAFTDSCGGGDGCCSTTVACVASRVRIQTTCGTACPPSWSSCDEYMAGGGRPSETCDPTTFGTCSRNTEVCCFRQASCVGGRVDEVEACADCAAECPSWTPPPPEGALCRGSADCGSDGRYCLPPGERAGCGICFRPEATCASDADCATGSVCEEYEVFCSCDGNRFATQCVADCRTSDRACPDGWECTDRGACEPVPCTAPGFDCGYNQECVFGAGASGADEHGCLRLACDGDFDCECGACIDGRCYDGPGVCMLPAA